MAFNRMHLVADVRELWEYKSFRARIFFAIIPTVFGVAFGSLALDRTMPYEYDASQSYIEPPSGKAGIQVTIVWRVRVHRHNCSGQIERRLFDVRTNAIIVQYDPVPIEPTPVPTRDFTWLRRTILLPEKLPLGRLGYNANTMYACNWFQAVFPTFAIRHTTPTLFFDVKE